MGILEDMVVSPAVRGAGVGAKLLEQALALARSNGCKRITLSAERGWPAVRWITRYFNARGRAFYDRYTDGTRDFIMYQWNRN